MSRKEYFAYGSNLNFEQMAYRCPEATVVGTAKLDGYELAFRRGYLTILPKEGASVEGLIWSVTDHDESQLDCYEGYPTFYDKETMTVTDASGTGHAVLIYIMEEPWCSRPQEPGGNYLNTVLEGCRQTGVPQEPVLKALESAVEGKYGDAIHRKSVQSNKYPADNTVIPEIWKPEQTLAFLARACFFYRKGGVYLGC